MRRSDRRPLKKQQHQDQDLNIFETCQDFNYSWTVVSEKTSGPDADCDKLVEKP